MAQEFHPWTTKGLKVIHLSYHRGRHYNSVRSKADPGTGPAAKYPISHPLIQKQAKVKTEAIPAAAIAEKD